MKYFLWEDAYKFDNHIMICIHLLTINLLGAHFNLYLDMLTNCMLYPHVMGFRGIKKFTTMNTIADIVK